MPNRPPSYLQRLKATRPQPVRRDEKPRPSACAQGYGRPWRRLRLLKLKTDPMCETGCGSPATEVDHIKAKSKGGTDDWGNLMSMCESCHSKKTVREDGALRRAQPGTTDKN